MKQHNKISKTGFFILGAMCLAFMAPVFAAPDVIYPSAATWTVNSNAVGSGGISNSFSDGSNGATTLDVDVYENDLITMNATWSIKNNAGGGGNTSYSRTVEFVVTQTNGTASITLPSIPNCTVTGNTSTCSTAVSFTAPAPDTYQITVNANDINSGSGHINERNLAINFTVVNSDEPLNTKLTVDPQCFILNQGNVDLTAKLEEFVSGNPITGADIDFYIDLPSSSIGTEKTVATGIATLSHNINGLSAGEHDLYAEFLDNAIYNSSNGSNTLGIDYLFVGFQQPINPEGNSIFGNGQVIPVKIKIADYNNQPVPNATPKVYVVKVNEDLSLGDVTEATSVSAADSGNTMRYVATDDHYIFNWDLKNLANGTYRVRVDLGDAGCHTSFYEAVVTVAKKGGKK